VRVRGWWERSKENRIAEEERETKNIFLNSIRMVSGRYKEITQALNNAAVRCENAELRVQILEKMIADAAVLCLGVEDRLWSEYEITHPLRVQRLKHRDTVDEISDSSMMLGLIKHSVAVSNRLIDDGMNQLSGVADSINKLAVPFEERDVLQEIPDLSHMSLEQLSNLRQKLAEPPAHRRHAQLPRHHGKGAKDADSIRSRQHGEAHTGSESDDQSTTHSQAHATPHREHAVLSRETSTPAHETGHTVRRGPGADRHAPRD
jgi:hypothetical protein